MLLLLPWPASRLFTLQGRLCRESDVSAGGLGSRCRSDCTFGKSDTREEDSFRQ